MKEQPYVVTDEKGRKVWLWPDGYTAPYLAGGNDDDGGDDDGGDDNNGDGGDGELAKTRDALKKANKEAADNRRALKKLQAQLGNVDPDEYQRLKDEEARREQEGLEAKGEYDKALQKERDKFDIQLKKSQENGDAWRGRYEKMVVDNALLNGAAAANAINPNAVVTLIRQDYNITVTDEGKVEITDGDGKVVMDDDGRAMGPSDVVKSYLNQNQYLVKASNNRGSESRGNRDTNSDQGELSSKDRIARGLSKLRR